MIKYRPEIDGLRALAILAVIFFHLNVPYFDGGFVGVDVFFVISGYLITSIIWSELDNDNFKFLEFYKRRVIRLAPAFLFVTFTVTLVCVFIMLPRELNVYFKTLLSSFALSSNMYLWSEVGGYFGKNIYHFPLLHFWSLSVEEQFYIVWPLFSFFVFKFGIKDKNKFSYVCLFLFITSLVISEYFVNRWFSASYYFMPTRACEMLLGAYIAVSDRFKQQSSNRGLSTVGILMILYSVFTYEKGMIFPGYSVLLPCLGTALLLIFLQNDVGVGKVFSNSFVVYIGKVSYPAYLWHWPLISFVYITGNELTLVNGTIIFVLTFILATFTYEYVEKKAKNHSKLSGLKIIGLGYITPMLLVGSLFLILLRLDFLSTLHDKNILVMSDALSSDAAKVRGRCNEGPIINFLNSDECVIGVEKGSPDVLLIGDSHANHFSGFIDVLLKKERLQGYDITQSNTIYLPGASRFYYAGDKLIKHEQFETRNAAITQHLIHNKYKFVVLGGSFVSHFENSIFSSLNGNNEQDEVSKEIFEDSLKEAIRIVIKSDSTPVIIKGNPTYDFDVSSCELNNTRFSLNIDCNLSRPAFDDKFINWNELVNKLKVEFNALRVIDLDDLFCNDDECTSTLDGIPLYLDGSHLNDAGSRLLANKYLAQYKNPFK